MNTFFDGIKAGLEEALAHSQGQNNGTVLTRYTTDDVRAIREKTGLTQREFAAAFQIGLGTLRHWEHGERQPRGPSSVLLKLIDHDPQYVLTVIHGEPRPDQQG